MRTKLKIDSRRKVRRWSESVRLPDDTGVPGNTGASITAVFGPHYGSTPRRGVASQVRLRTVLLFEHLFSLFYVRSSILYSWTGQSFPQPDFDIF